MNNVYNGTRFIVTPEGLVIEHAGNMGTTMQKVIDNVDTVFAPGTFDKLRALPGVTEEGSPDYLYTMIVRVSDEFKVLSSTWTVRSHDRGLGPGLHLDDAAENKRRLKMERIELSTHRDAAAFVAGEVETAAWAQMMVMLDSEVTEGCKVRFMPDFHYGKGCVIGTTMTLVDKVVPNMVGVDIGCGVCATKLQPFKTEPDWESFDNHVREMIPAGVGRLHEKINYGSPPEWCEAAERVGLGAAYLGKAAGTLGGGNHFIEIAIDDTGTPWLCIHSGSRKFGYDIAVYHQRVADEGKGKRNELNWLDLHAEEGQAYLADMKLAQSFAILNRRLMSLRAHAWFLLNGMTPESHPVSFDTMHNYIDFSGETPLLRKGAVRAQAGELLIIPFNMKVGSVICSGRSNPDWNNSAPHGAGRKMSRGQAKRELSLEDYEAEMAGVWSSCVSAKTLDEAPGAYKDADAIRDAIEPTVEIMHTLTPVYNFKA